MSSDDSRAHGRNVHGLEFCIVLEDSPLNLISSVIKTVIDSLV